MSAIILFEEKQVRRAWNKAEEKWYFSVDDVVEVLTGTVNVKDYVKKLRKRDSDLNTYWGTNCPLVAMPGADGKIRPIRAAHTQALLRIIQSIPSPKAEPFKLWLAKVGFQRLEEIENPELAAKRTREIYQQKGYSEEWIEKRLRGIAVRDELISQVCHRYSPAPILSPWNGEGGFLTDSGATFESIASIEKERSDRFDPLRSVIAVEKGRNQTVTKCNALKTTDDGKVPIVGTIDYFHSFFLAPGKTLWYIEQIRRKGPK